MVILSFQIDGEELVSKKIKPLKLLYFIMIDNNNDVVFYIEIFKIGKKEKIVMLIWLLNK